MIKSNLHIVHHNVTTPETIQDLLKTGKVGISPHIGNLDTVINPGYLQIVSLVGGLSIELVDTVKLDDKDFHPKVVSARFQLPDGVAHKETGKVHLVSNKHNNRMAGSPNFRVPDELTELFLPGAGTDMTVAGLHRKSVDEIAHPSSVTETSSKMFSGMGEIAQYILHHASLSLDRPLRFVDQTGVITSVQHFDASLPIFGADGSGMGLLPPVEALMACEAISAVLKEQTVSHIGGSSMFNEYTRDPDVMEPVEQIFRSIVEGELGLTEDMEYVVLNKADLASRLPKLGCHVLTQYDLIHEKMAVS